MLGVDRIGPEFEEKIVADRARNGRSPWRGRIGQSRRRLRRCREAEEQGWRELENQADWPEVLQGAIRVSLAWNADQGIWDAWSCVFSHPLLLFGRDARGGQLTGASRIAILDAAARQEPI